MRPDVEWRLRRAVDQLSPLPVLQGTVLEVRALAEDPEASTEAVVGAFERDEAFAANMLRFANSAAAARPIRARTVRQAVTLAGRRSIARMATEASTYRFLERVPGTGRSSRGQMHVPRSPSRRLRRPRRGAPARSSTPPTSPRCCTTSAGS